MASLLREQTRIKESLEGALERQKEGMQLLTLKNTFSTLVPHLHLHVIPLQQFLVFKNHQN